MARTIQEKKLLVPEFGCASIPHTDMLCENIPKWAWESAQRAAQRSPLQRYHIGAVLLDPKMKSIIEIGWAHTGAFHVGNYRANHAEQHALRRAKHQDLHGAHCVIWAANRNFTGTAWSSCPCNNCMITLAKRGIATATFPIRTVKGWRVISVDPSEVFADESKCQHRYELSHNLSKKIQKET